MSSRDFAEKLAAHMKTHRQKTLRQKCREIGISVQTSYAICRIHGVDSKIGPRTGARDEKEIIELIEAYSS